MTRRFALQGETSKTTLTYQGRVIVHTDRDEMEYLFPGTKVIEIGSATPETDTISLRQHPGTCHLKFPLERSDFGSARDWLIEDLKTINAV